jgi:hypothetical protein
MRRAGRHDHRHGHRPDLAERFESAAEVAFVPVGYALHEVLL